MDVWQEVARAPAGLCTPCVLAVALAAHLRGSVRLLRDCIPSEELDEERKEAMMEQGKPFCTLLILGLSSVILLKYGFLTFKVLLRPESLTTFDFIRALAGGIYLLVWSMFLLGHMQLSIWRIKLLAVSVSVVLLLREMIMDFQEDALMMAFRATAGLAMMDHCQALLLQSGFVVLRTAVKYTTSTVEELTMHIVGAVLLWVIWFTVQTCLKQFLLLTQKVADAKASLEAVRALLSSQCDAEACLSSAFVFQDPSSKLAHFLGCEVDQLKSRSLDEFLAESDRQRFRSLIESSTHALELGKRQQYHALAATVSLNVANRQIEVNLRLCSVPALQSDGYFFLVALNLVRGDIFDAESMDPGAISAGEGNDSSPSDTSPTHFESASFGGELAAPLNKHLQFHARNKETANAFSSVCVTFDSRTLEVSNLRVSLNIGSWKQSDRTFLKNCILEDVWPGFSSWLKSWGQGQVTNSPPPIVLFRFPQLLRMRNVLAARQSDLKKCRGEDGRPTGEICLRLRDIRLRKVLRRGKVKKRSDSVASRESMCSATAAVQSPNSGRKSRLADVSGELPSS